MSDLKSTVHAVLFLCLFWLSGGKTAQKRKIMFAAEMFVAPQCFRQQGSLQASIDERSEELTELVGMLARAL
ncbi:MAG: hypothetical protein J5597_06585 [Spirochaetaceae bacterium]|nr:hypothetical protein [Spirochaetaceae bacterium]